ncbi:hypothetical protein Poly51_44810 [Rubripirellula tenax]|uniref:DUF1559 domain-containing protein n=1 Tax=Rubripirellula tenax TaxID=2528015 RepID=A0A5C6ELV4_9BACT|nr:DUF1559 domain-containing protein [Rubripirellula tenax]TWU48581.1 hypothetical protein Poly51_44810 [Rubripirellula tenax]
MDGHSGWRSANSIESAVAETPRSQKRTGLTVLELLVTIAIIGILVAIVLPAIGSAREAARRVVCVDHMREIGIALHNHHQTLGSLPVGWQFDQSQQSAYGWVVPTLPYLGEPALMETIDVTLSIHHPRHETARRTPIATLLCPSDLTEPVFTLFSEDEDDDDEDENDLSGYRTILPFTAMPLIQLPTANYVGVFGTIEPDDGIPAPIGDGAFLENRRVRFRDFERGLSETLAVGERTMAFVPSTWLGVDLNGEDAAARLVGSTLEGINSPVADECEFSSRHPGGANFLWADGHVSFITENIDLHEYHQLARLRMQ